MGGFFYTYDQYKKYIFGISGGDFCRCRGGLGPSNRIAIVF